MTESEENVDKLVDKLVPVVLHTVIDFTFDCSTPCLSAEFYVFKLNWLRLLYYCTRWCFLLDVT